jgi:hypothetical protein
VRHGCAGERCGAHVHPIDAEYSVARFSARCVGRAARPHARDLHNGHRRSGA